MKKEKEMPSSSPRPRFTEEEARRLARDLYGLKGGLIELPSERDQNFHVRAESGREFVLKIANAAEKKEVLEFQSQAVRRLKSEVSQIAWPEVRETVRGEEIATAEHSGGSRHLVRLLNYLPGPFLAQVRPHGRELLRSLGAFLGTMDRALAGFDHPAMDRDLKWNMKRAPATIRRYLPQVEGRERRETVERFLSLYQEHVVPAAARLRTSVIYNDANDNNVLVGPASADPFERFSRVVGVIDFGDMLHGYPVCELAVGAAYAMMGKNQPLEAAASVVSGYHDVYPLTEPELETLFPMIGMRLCLSVVISAQQKKQETDNEYLTISEKPAWALLGQLRAVNPRLAHYTFRRACGLPPCPRTPAVVEWLKSHGEDCGPVVQPDPREKTAVVFDLSPGSPQLSRLEEPWEVQSFTDLLFGELKLAKARVGIGRYNEARRIYTSGTFEVAGNDGREWRTVHLGVDLYMEPGSAVTAPLEGTVHSLRDNDAPLDYGSTVILEHNPAGGVAFYTLYGHLSRNSLAGLHQGQTLKKGETVGWIGSSEENGGWPPHLHFQIVSDLLDRTGDFPGVALPGQRELWLSLCPDPNLILGIPEINAPVSGHNGEEIVGLRHRYLGPTLSISYRRPLKIVRGFRQYLYDDVGRTYLDAVNNVPHVGHCHPRVVQAAREQMAVLNTNTRYLHDNLVEYALRLSETLPEPLRVFYFVCSGSEANDLALRLARTHTGGRDVVVVSGAYHGNLSSLIEISPYKFDGPGGRGAPPYVHKVPTPDGYRGPYKRRDPEAGIKYARDVENALAAVREQGKGVAAFMTESLMSCAGIVIFPDGYLKEAFRHTRRAGGVCIADEVQVGFGRLGSHFWGFETQGVVPDIVTMGKPIGNGHPLAAVVTTPEIAASFQTGMEYFNTFGGNPVSCAVGLAVLDVLRDEKLQQNALEVGGYLKAGLEKLKPGHPLIGDVRGLGLFLGVELVLDRDTLAPATAEAAYAAERMKERGILISTEGPFRNVLKIRPPLVFTKTDADFLLETLKLVLEESALQPR
jgi:4-aminobutyrate aminotransferase-like enzyme/Ser/Thr protein kinase RdoA (MazF antagonist)